MLKTIRLALLGTTVLGRPRPRGSAAGPGDDGPGREADAAERPDDARQPEPVAEQPDPGQKAAFAKVWQKFAESPSRLADPVRVLQPRHRRRARPPARAGPRRPRARLRDRRSFQLALFVKNGVLQPLDAVFHQGGDRRPLPVHPRRHHRRRRPYLRLVVGHRPARALLQQGPRATTPRRPGTS